MSAHMDIKRFSASTADIAIQPAVRPFDDATLILLSLLKQLSIAS